MYIKEATTTTRAITISKVLRSFPSAIEKIGNKKVLNITFDG